MKKLIITAIIGGSLFASSSFSQAVRQPVPKKLADATSIVPVTTVKRQDFAVPFVNKTLPNGLEVIVLPDPAVPLVTVELDVRNGSFTEPPELNGLSHLYEHMFFKPKRAAFLLQCENVIRNGGRPSSLCDIPLAMKSTIGDVSFLQNIDTLGITYNGTTREEVVDYYFTTTSPYLETAIK